MDYSFPSFSQIFRFSIFCAEGTFGVGEVASAYYGQLLETQRQESPAVEAAHPTISGQFSQHFEDWSVAESLLKCRSVVLRFQRWKPEWQRSNFPLCGKQAANESLAPVADNSWKNLATTYRYRLFVGGPFQLEIYVLNFPATWSRVMSAITFLGDRSAISESRRANKSKLLAISPVHPVWWLAPRPAPLSPWKYS